MPSYIDARNYSVVKSNTLIQKTRYRLSLQEQKIVLYLISKIKPDDEELMLYDFKIKEFCEVCGIDSKNGTHYVELKKAIKNLSDKSYWVTLDNGTTETIIRWIDRPFFDRNSGTVRVQLDSFMKPYLLQLKEQFTQYTLYYVLAMNSKYSIRLYELLKSFEYKGSCEFAIDEFKKMIDAETYKQHTDFNRYVLDTAMKEINEYSDIAVSRMFEKTGRRFTKIKFTIKTKKEFNERMETAKKIEAKLSRQ